MNVEIEQNEQNEQLEEEEELTRDNIREPIMLFIQMALKTIDKNTLKEINSIDKTWKSQVSKLFGITQKKLVLEINALKVDGLNEQQITDKLIDKLFEQLETIKDIEE
jgi:hypothetical protein